MSRSKTVNADTVVIGAGAAGAVITARMTENPNKEVLLLEAGPDYVDPNDWPQDLLDGTKNSVIDHDWGYWFNPTRGQTPFIFPRGRVVGGSSAVNTCIALRGQPYDFDEWAAHRDGLSHWAFDQCLPAFKRLENDLDFDDEMHGNEGPIPVRRHTKEEWVPWQGAFVEAALDLGFPACEDQNAIHAEGVGAHPMNKINGRRMNAAMCYLTPKVRQRDNLRICANTTIERILFENGQVCGLACRRDGEALRVRTRNVILCAGSIGSLGILLRSGIGPRDTLARLSVSCVRDVPEVGKRLLDHPGAAMVLLPKHGVSNIRDPLIQTVLRYRSEDVGLRSDIQLQPGSTMPLPGVEMPLVTIMCSIGKPRGSGTIHFPDAKVDTKPVINGRHLEHPDDLAQATEAMELAALLASSKHMKALASPMIPRANKLSSRKAIREWVVRMCGSGYHPCGTVPMGSAVDGYGAFDGVSGLRVADASIMPTVPSANIHLPTLMIGERFGEWLRDGKFD